MPKCDILILMSDQHAPQIAGFMGDTIVRTPNLDAIAGDGVCFSNAYTSCPLCVPARASFMTGKMPSELGVFSNDDAYSECEMTFVEKFRQIGYETTLCGRMHFMGEDQRHGFTNRIAADITSGNPCHPAITRDDFGQFKRVFAQKYCTEIVGCGNSPVLEYDNYVLMELERYLKRDSGNSQLIICGTYAPHFPYVAPQSLVEYYIEQLKYTPDECMPNYDERAFSHKKQLVDKELLINIRACYYALIETMDWQVGRARRAWAEYLTRTGREGILLYMSDHGDQIGRKGYFGKQTFFEYSSKIPLIICGNGIASGKRSETPVSIREVGQTLLALVNHNDDDGKGFFSALTHPEHEQSRTVVSEFYDRQEDGTPCTGYMVMDGRFKLIEYFVVEQEPLLFDLQADPDELVNVASMFTDVVSRLEAAIPEQHLRLRRLELFATKTTDSDFSVDPENETDLWLAPEKCVQPPVKCRR